MFETKNPGSIDTNIGTIRKHEQFLKNYDVKQLIQYQYDTGTTQVQHEYDILNEVSIFPN